MFFFEIERLRCDLLEDLWVIHGHLAQDFAIKDDAFDFQGIHELGVGRSGFACSGIDAGLHEGSVVSLLELTTDIGLTSGFDVRDLCELDLGLSAPEHALGALEDVFAMLDMHHSAFDSWHRCKIRSR